MVITLPLENCHTGGVFMVAEFKKKRLAEPNPNGSRSETLLVGPNMVNTFAAKRDFSQIYRSLPNASVVET